MQYIQGGVDVIFIMNRYDLNIKKSLVFQGLVVSTNIFF